jgi:hypothetical protein
MNSNTKGVSYMLGSVDSLRKEVDKRHIDGENKRKLAESLYMSADSHEKSGNTTQAKIDRDSAQRYESEAEEAEKQAGIYEMEAFARMQKAAGIDKEMDHLKQEFDKKMADLEMKKKTILG